MTRRTCAALLAAPLLAVASCNDSSATPPAPPVQPTSAPCADVVVDRFKELIIVDDAVVDDVRAKNAADGPWSFRHLIEELAPADRPVDEFLSEWLKTWTVETRINQFPLTVRPDVRRAIICPWLQATPANNCDAFCRCTDSHFDLAKAPFRLLAISNRIDLRETRHLGGVGESRFVYGLTGGPGDDPSSPPLLMTVIFEYGNPEGEGRSAHFWAEQWHSLGQFATFDESYRSRLHMLTDQIVRRGAQPTAPGGNALQQLRTNEREFDWIWELRQFEFDGWALQPAAVTNTPDKSLSDSPLLTQFVNENRDLILAGQHLTPPTLTAGTANPFNAWRVPVDEELRHAFAGQTCDGCHQTEEHAIDVNFHVSPFRRGVEKLSPHLHNPNGPEEDELAKRTRSLQRALCQL
jgi:hypothetical protein